MNLVTVELADAVAVVTLNRPDKMNALSRALQTELAEAIGAVSADPAARVAILTGAGERAFSAGLDLREVGEHGLGQGETRYADPVRALGACAKPVIAAINGVAVTGGFELALACDILIASTPNARFADTHVRVGVIPGWGLSQRLSRLVGVSRAKELSLSGNYIDAETALAWGLVNRVVEPAALMQEAHQLAADIASCDPDMVRNYKALIDDGFAPPFGEAMDARTPTLPGPAMPASPPSPSPASAPPSRRGAAASRTAAKAELNGPSRERRRSGPQATARSCGPAAASGSLHAHPAPGSKARVRRARPSQADQSAAGSSRAPSVQRQAWPPSASSGWKPQRASNETSRPGLPPSPIRRLLMQIPSSRRSTPSPVQAGEKVREHSRAALAPAGKAKQATPASITGSSRRPSTRRCKSRSAVRFQPRKPLRRAPPDGGGWPRSSLHR